MALQIWPRSGAGAGWRAHVALPAALLGLAVVLAIACRAAEAAQPIKIGVLRIAGAGPIYIAKDRGYFVAQGLDAELVFFDAAEPVGVAVVSGAIDFGAVGATAGFYSLASRGELRIIAGLAREVPGFRTLAFVASNQAYAAGLKFFKDLPGHSVAVSHIGSGSHYSVALIAEKYGFELKSLRLLPLQSIANEISAVRGGQADAGVITSTPTMPALERGEMKLLGFIGDETPWQIGCISVSTRTADQRHEIVERFLAAFRQGMRDYRDAFIDAAGRPKTGPTAPAILAILAKYTGQPAARIARAIPYVDDRLDVRDIEHQIAWYKAQRMLKGDADLGAIIDRRYVVPVPER